MRVSAASRAELYAWGSLAVTLGVMWFLGVRFLDGWQLAEASPKHLWWTYITAVVATIIAESVLAGSLARRGADGGGGEIPKDERDLAIEARAERHSHWFMVAVVNIIVIQVLASMAYENKAIVPSFRLGSTEGLVFTLVMLLYATHAVKMVSTIVGHRR